MMIIIIMIVIAIIMFVQLLIILTSAAGWLGLLPGISKRGFSRYRVLYFYVWICLEYVWVTGVEARWSGADRWTGGEVFGRLGQNTVVQQIIA